MDALGQIEELLRGQPAGPPVEQWQPPLSGTIDIRIDTQGDWYHEGTRIQRQPLVNLFASILRREQDGEYYLVTPVEKWRIRVEDAPLLAVDMDIGGAGAERKILFTLNTGERVLLDAQHALTVTDVDGEPRPYLALNRGLSARLTRAVFYRLVEAAEQRSDTLQVSSCGTTFSLGRTGG